MAAVTRTGGFPVGFRRGWGGWQKDLGKLVAWAKKNDFACIDVGALDLAEMKSIFDAGLKVGSADLKDWPGLCTADKGKRKASVDANAEYIKQCVKLGVGAFFMVILPEDGAKPRKENFDYAVEAFSMLCDKLKTTKARIVLEGWPGGGPNFAAQCCTPEGYREMFKAVPNKIMSVNFDPSHLIRMGIDHVRFLEEFVERVGHVHAKDTELDFEALYQYGWLQPSLLNKPHVCGEQYWRYTTPGHGVARWGKLFSILAAAKYKGFVSIELEDEDFLGGDEKEQQGLLASRDFLIYA